MPTQKNKTEMFKLLKENPSLIDFKRDLRPLGFISLTDIQKSKYNLEKYFTLRGIGCDAYANYTKIYGINDLYLNDYKELIKDIESTGIKKVSNEIEIHKANFSYEREKNSDQNVNYLYHTFVRFLKSKEQFNLIKEKYQDRLHIPQILEYLSFYEKTTRHIEINFTDKTYKFFKYHDQFIMRYEIENF